MTPETEEKTLKDLSACNCGMCRARYESWYRLEQQRQSWIRRDNENATIFDREAPTEQGK